MLAGSPLGSGDVTVPVGGGAGGGSGTGCGWLTLQVLKASTASRAQARSIT